MKMCALVNSLVAFETNIQGNNGPPKGKFDQVADTFLDKNSPMYNGVPAIQSDSPVYYRLVT